MARTDEPEIDPDRMRRRHDVRLRIAKRELLRRRAEDLRRKVASLQEEAEAAADRHRDRTEPLRAELREIEEKIAGLMAARKPVPEKLESRRVTLIEEIDSGTDALDREVQELQRRMAAPAAEAERLDFEAAAQDGLEIELASALANPVLLREQFVAEKTVEWLSNRLRAARKQQAELEAAIAQEERLGDKTAASVYRRRLFKWEAEVEAAESALAAAQAAVAEAHQRLLDE